MSKLGTRKLILQHMLTEGDKPMIRLKAKEFGLIVEGDVVNCSHDFRRCNVLVRNVDADDKELEEILREDLIDNVIEVELYTITAYSYDIQSRFMENIELLYEIY